MLFALWLVECADLGVPAAERAFGGRDPADERTQAQHDGEEHGRRVRARQGRRGRRESDVSQGDLHR